MCLGDVMGWVPLDYMCFEASPGWHSSGVFSPWVFRLRFVCSSDFSTLCFIPFFSGYGVTPYFFYLSSWCFWIACLFPLSSRLFVLPAYLFILLTATRYLWHHQLIFKSRFLLFASVFTPQALCSNLHTSLAAFLENAFLTLLSFTHFSLLLCCCPAVSFLHELWF